MDKIITNIPKRRTVSVKECENDLGDCIERLFKAVRDGINNYNQLNIGVSQCAKARGFDATMLNTMITDSLQKEFSNQWERGKHGRFLLNINGYSILVKKLDNKNMPMNIKTKNVEAINNQAQLSLFNDNGFNDPLVSQPIVYLGYTVDKQWKIVNDVKMVYIDESKVKWVLSDSSVKKDTLPFGFVNNAPELKVKLKRGDNKQDAI